MQADNPSTIQFGPGGEQWREIPAGAPIYASDGVPVGTVVEVGTAYLRASDSMMGDGGLYIPLQTIRMYDPDANAVHLSVTADAVRGIVAALPANDPTSLQAVHDPTLPLPATPPLVPTHATTIVLREQYLVLETLPNVIKEVTIRRATTPGDVTVSETVRKESASVGGVSSE